MTTTNTTPPVSPSCRQCRSPIAEQATAGLCSSCVGLRVRDAYHSAPRSAPPFADTPTLPPGFTFVDHLGRGGMGHVYLAHQENLDRYVALKQLAEPWQSEPRAQKRFLHEARAVARLSHPHIVPVLEIGEADVPLWFTMEFVEGGDLTQLLEHRGGRLPWRVAVALMIPVAEAIEHAHRAGIAHRDLKPSNILLDAAGQPKVADFGLAWVAGQTRQELTHAGEVVGTPSYLPPEAVGGRGRDDDARPGDIYALGAVLYHLIAGQPPFTGDNPMAILAAISQRPAPRLSSHDGLSPIPVSLDRICATCLEKDPGQRFVCAAEFATALRRVQDDQTWDHWHRDPRARTFAMVVTMAVASAALVWTLATKPRPAPTNVAKLAQASIPTTAPPVVAILQESVETNDAKTALLAEGLNDEIVATLNRTTDLKVLATRSVRAAQAGQSDLGVIGRNLGASVVLSTKVRHVDDRYAVAAQLVNVADGTLRWARTFSRSEAQLLNLQTDLATELAVNLGQTLRPDKAADDGGAFSRHPEAQQKYLEAKRLFNASGANARLAQAERLLGEALTIDSTFAAAYAQLSLVHTQMVSWGADRSEKRLELGLDAAQRALQANPALPDGEIALGLCYLRGTRDFELARQSLEKALAIAPSNPDALAAMAQTVRRQGDFAAAARWFEAARELDPLNSGLAYNAIDTVFKLRDYEKASTLITEALRRMPDSVPLKKLEADLWLAKTGDPSHLVAEIESRDPTVPSPLGYVYDYAYAMTYAHRLSDAIEKVQSTNFTDIEGQSVYLTKDGWLALLYDADGQTTLARSHASTARASIDRRMATGSVSPRLALHAAEVEAVLGNQAEVRRLLEGVFSGHFGKLDAVESPYLLCAAAIAAEIAKIHAIAADYLSRTLHEPSHTSQSMASQHPILSRISIISRNR